MKSTTAISAPVSTSHNPEKLASNFYANLHGISELFAGLIKKNLQLYCSCAERRDFEQLLAVKFHIAESRDKISLTDQSHILLKRVHILIGRAKLV